MRRLPLASAVLASASLFSAAASIVEAPGVPATPGFNLFKDKAEIAAAPKLTAPPAVALKAGDMAMVFEGTALTSIADHLGGDIQHAGTGADANYWLCYSQAGSATTPAALVWFQSGDSSDAHALDSIAVETAPVAVPAECGNPKEPLDLETGLPGLGAKTADVVTAFGPAQPKDGLAIYLHEGEIADRGAKEKVLTYLGYKFDGDLVAAYQIGQVTAK